MLFSTRLCLSKAMLGTAGILFRVRVSPIGVSSPHKSMSARIDLIIFAVGFSINPISNTATYGKPPASPAFDSAQIRIVMDPRDVQTAKDLITGPNAPEFLELYNEPDFSFGGWTPITSPEESARTLQDLINTPTRTKFISPAPAYTYSSWLSDFFARCAGCLDKIPIIGVHVYSPDAQKAIDQIVAVHNSYPTKKLWITELSPASSTEQGCALDQNGMISWMQTVTKFAAATGYVDKIFWNCGEFVSGFFSRPSIVSAHNFPSR